MAVPFATQGFDFGLELGRFRAQSQQHALGVRISARIQGLNLGPQRNQSLNRIFVFWFETVGFNALGGCGFVEQVNGGFRQEAILQVALGQAHARANGTLFDGDLVVILVTGSNRAHDLDGAVDARLFELDGRQ